METSSNKTSSSLSYTKSSSTKKKLSDVIINRSALSSPSLSERTMATRQLQSISDNTTQNQTYYNNLNIENMEFFLLKDNKSDKTQKDDVSSVSSKSAYAIDDESYLRANNITRPTQKNDLNTQKTLKRSQSI